jgi:hypothetical protein
MRLLSAAVHCKIILIVLFPLVQCPSDKAQASLPTVTIHQLSEVWQGRTGEFEIKILPGEKPAPVILRLQAHSGAGRAAFADGSMEMTLNGSDTVYVRGLASSDLPGALTLTAWPEGAAMPAATAFFDVLAPTLDPRIFFNGFDVTGTRQTVAVGQRVQLTVVLHPGLPVLSQDWSIGDPGDYTGGFVHTPLHGGPQPVVRGGSTTSFYWVTPGLNRTVTYRLKLSNGLTEAAAVTFDVEGPSSVQVQVVSGQAMVAPATRNASQLGMLGPGISFRAGYFLPEELLRNFTWVQVIESDDITMKDSGVTMHCVPKSQPVAGRGAGLDTVYPYDTHNPTLDNPRLELTSDTPEYSRVLHARMYLLWSSGLSNSIAVPLGFVDWSFAGEVVLKDAKANAWRLKSGRAAPKDPAAPFTPSHAYPMWNSLVPYTEVLTCNWENSGAGGPQRAED